MLLNFKKVILHNFLSYGHAEIDLKYKHYCLVSGVNQNPKDKALSNGAGKSTWGSAICWALTGQTINGLSTNIKNINVDENSCYVTLEFDVDGDEYIITRYKNPKSDLSIMFNGKDISGKGIRESEDVLAKRLPDLTNQLIASIIILGQGLPCKFTSNSPSGRKEVLEKLSKSDFMIQDLKERINSRLVSLNKDLREVEDALLVLKTKLSVNESDLLKLENKLAELKTDRDFESEISKLKNLIDDATTKNKKLTEDINSKNDEYGLITEQINKVNSKKMEELNEDSVAFNEFSSLYLNKKSELDSNIRSLENKIRELKNIKDVCPTCGQKLPNVIKPSTELEEKELTELKATREKLISTYEENKNNHLAEVNKINNTYKIRLDDLNKTLLDVKTDLAKLRSTPMFDLVGLQVNLTKVTTDKENYITNLNSTKTAIEENKKLFEELNKEQSDKLIIKDDINAHIKVVNQMNTLIKRDFRGYLLQDVIKYISLKAKEYAQDVFESDELEFELQGNNIEISYCSKAFENLSGGEKQKVDLIIQLAIRDMMKGYLGFSSNILILDEIFDQLDINGCTNILNLLSTKLDDVESMFIISHRAGELEIPYDSEMIVIKDEKGVSTIKWQ